MLNNKKTSETELEVHTDASFLEFLVCPLTRTSLDYDKENQELISRAARLAYPIRNGIPIILVEEAREIEDLKIASGKI